MFMQKLDTKYRQVIELTFLTGYTHEEVADMLALPLGTVKTRCRCGLRQLRLFYS
jgi:RNA polymerase sigma-70 factor (ECF subfamily)